ncbi:MAG: hypothetical protein AAEJ53_00340 [Myxococcota bacterium]
MDVGDLPARVDLQPFLDAGRVAEGGGHHEEERAWQADERHLPGDPAIAVPVVVELVEHHVGDIRLLSFAECHVRQHLGGAADHRGLGVDAGVPGEHPDALGAELLAELEELLAHEGLDGCGVEGATPLAEALEVQRQRHQRFSRAGGR